MICPHCQRPVRGSRRHCPHCQANLHVGIWEEVRRPTGRPSFLAFAFSCLMKVLLLTLMGGAMGLLVLYFVDWWLADYPPYLPNLLGALGLTVGFGIGVTLALLRFLHGRP